MKILAIVITYYPNISDLQRNILSYINSVDQLIIWENTPKSSCSNELYFDEEINTKIIYKGSGKNEYIAYPLNKAIEWAQQNAFTHVLTLDQDSCFKDGVFYRYKQIILSDKSGRNKIWGANPNNMYRSHCTVLQVPQCITSGTIYPTPIFENLGFFREDFAIYVVDVEFGIRARVNGIESFVVIEATLEHTFGKPTKTYFGYITTNYSAFVTYLIIRNTIVTWIEYPKDFKARIGFVKYSIFYRLIAILLHEDDKLNKISAIFIGIIDGVRRKMQLRSF